MKRIMMLASVAVVMAAMMAGSVTSAGAVPAQTCPPGTTPGVPGPTGEEGCGATVGPGHLCPAGTAPVSPDSDMAHCWGPYVKEACKTDHAALGYESQGQCIKAANQAAST